jgi:hypothetical protein
MNASRTPSSATIYFEFPDLRAATKLPHSNQDQERVPGQPPYAVVAGIASVLKWICIRRRGFA